MKVLMIGGTGLLGSAAAQIFVDRGNEIKTLALPPLPEGAPLPKEWKSFSRMQISFLTMKWLK